MVSPFLGHGSILSTAVIIGSMDLHFKDTAQVPDKDFKIYSGILADYAKHLKKTSEFSEYVFDESSINLPFDEDILKLVLNTKRKYTNKKLKYIIDIGIGGSNLGTKAVYDAVFGYYDIVTPGRHPKMLFVDTNDSRYIKQISRFLTSIKSKDEVLLNIVSKSGTTLETIVNMQEILRKAPALKERTIITTAYESDLWLNARKENITCLPIPQKVGGRYSVFSPVGLFPLACAGVNIIELLKGAMSVVGENVSVSTTKNIAMQSAVVQYTNYKKGRSTHVNFFFHPELESLGKWYSQLLAESIGKEGVGITPLVALGSTDLHSLGQLFIGGPRDKFFTFVYSKDKSENIGVLHDFPSPEQALSAILQGVKQVYKKEELPFMEITLDAVNEHALGAFMQYKMIEVMFLGKLFGVNAFNQPDVELYKKETKKILM